MEDWEWITMSAMRENKKEIAKGGVMIVSKKG